MSDVVPFLTYEDGVAALRRTGDPDSQDVTLGQSRGAFTIGQEALRPIECHECACHGRHPGRYPATIQIADPVRSARAPECIVEQDSVPDHGDAQPVPPDSRDRGRPSRQVNQVRVAVASAAVVG